MDEDRKKRLAALSALRSSSKPNESSTPSLKEETKEDEDRGLMDSLGVGARGFAKGAGNILSDVVLSPLYLTKAVAGDKEYVPKEGEPLYPIDEMLNVLRKRPLPDMGIGSAAVKGLDYLTNDQLKPKNEEEEWVDYLSNLAGSFYGGGPLKLGAKAVAKGASKIMPGVVEAIAKRTPETVKGIGTTIGKVLNPLTPGQSAAAIGGMGLSELAREHIGEDTALKRGLNIALGMGGTHALNLGYENLKGKSLKNIVDKKRLERHYNAGQTPELASIVDPEKGLSNSIKSLSKTIQQTAGAGNTLYENKLKNEKVIKKHLGLEDFDLDVDEIVRLAPEEAGAIINKNLKKERDTFYEEAKPLKEKAFGKPLDADEYYKNYPEKAAVDLSREALDDLTKAFLQEAEPGQKNRFFDATDKQKFEMLDDFSKRELANPIYKYDVEVIKDGKPVLEERTIRINRQGPDDKSMHQDMLMPMNILRLLRRIKTSDKFNKHAPVNQKIPDVVRDAATILEKNNGWMPFTDFNRLRELINMGPNKQFRTAARADLLEHAKGVEAAGANPTASKDIQEYLNYHSKRKGEVSKDQDKVIQEKLLNSDVNQLERDKLAFKEFLGDLYGNKTLQNRYLKTTSQADAQTLWRELNGKMSWVETRQGSGPNIAQWMKWYSNLTKADAAFVNKLHKKAHPKSTVSLDDLSHIIQDIQSTEAHANTSGTAVHDFNQRFMYRDLPKAVGSIASAILTRDTKELKTAVGNVGKIISGPVLARALTKKFMLNPEFHHWLAKGNKLTNPQQVRAWLRNTPKIDGFPIQELKMALSVFNESLKRGRSEKDED